MAKFSARRMQQSCLRCHGDPKDAPASLIEQYGDKAGFYRPLGQVIGMDTVAIPLAKVKEGLWSKSVDTFVVIGGASFSFQHCPCNADTDYQTGEKNCRPFQQAVHQGDYSRIEAIRISGHDELACWPADSTP